MPKQDRDAPQSGNVLFQNLDEFQAVVYAHAQSMVVTGLHRDDALERAAGLIVRANDPAFMAALLERVVIKLGIDHPISGETNKSGGSIAAKSNRRPPQPYDI